VCVRERERERALSMLLLQAVCALC